MISKLNLRHYGCFRDSAFELGPVTVFSGPNESGKSTIFDALFDAVTEAPGTHAKVRRNSARYGRDRAAGVEGTLPPPEISPEEFLSVLAVDSGDLSIPEGKGPWIDRLKAQLFTDGIDPGEIARELAKEATEKKSTAHMKELAQLEREQASLEESLTEARRRREDMVSRRKEADAAAQRRETLQTELGQLVSRRKEAQAVLSVVEQQWRRKQLLQALSEVESLRRLEEELAGAPQPREEDMGALERLLGRRQELRTEEQAAAAAAERNASRVAEAREKLAATESEASALRQQIPVAQSLRSLLQHGFGRRVTLRRVAALVSGIALMLISALSVLFLPRQAQTIWPAVAGGLLGLLVILLGLRRKGPSLAEIRDRWLAATGRSLVSESPDGLVRELSGVESVLGHLEGRLAQEREALESLKRELEEAQGGLNQAVGRGRELEGEIQRWLSGFSLASVEEARRAAQRLREMEQERAILLRHLEPWREEFGVSGPGALEQELRARIASQEALAADTQLSEADIPSLRHRVAELEAREAELRREISELETEERTKRATYSEVFSGLPHQILTAERSLQEVRSRIDALERRRRAAGIAGEIFERLAEDSALQLGDLAEELGDAYRSITGSGARVSLESIDAREATAVDAGGAPRSLADLSQGTKDVLMWAFRIALARKARPEPSILVLDDPFLAVDAQRVGKCLSLLRDRLVSEDWQVVLLTKDEALAQAALKLHPASVLHRLSRRD